MQASTAVHYNCEINAAAATTTAVCPYLHTCSTSAESPAPPPFSQPPQHQDRVIPFVMIVLLLLNLLATLTSRRKTRMQLDDLKATVQALADEVTAMKQSITDEIARVEAAIAALKASGIDPALLEPITAQLQTAVDNLKSGQAQLDAEQPAPPVQAAGA